VDKAICALQFRHVRAVIAALRLIDISELEACAAAHGTDADRELVAAVRSALLTLPSSPHG
jgi:hypothetical protein